MPIEKERPAKKDVLNQLAGITGLGWTTSVLGFLSTVVASGNSIVSRLVADPQSLLYVGAVFFVATVGLDRLADVSDGENGT